MKRYVPIILALISSPAWATGTPASVPTSSTSHADSASQSTSSAHSAATSTANQTQTASGTATQSQTASGGNASQSQAATGGTSSALNEGNTTSYVNQRSAPPVYAPPAFPAIGCGRGVSLGGSGVGGGGIVAFNWADSTCVAIATRISYAQALAAIARADLACAVLMGHPLAAEVWPGGAPSCEIRETVTVTPPVSVQVVVPESVATKEYVQEVVKRTAGK